MYLIILCRLITILFIMKNSFLHTSSFKNKFPSYLVSLLQKRDFINKHKLNSIHIRDIGNDRWYKEHEVDNYIKNNTFIQNKKLISISPGGYQGFYVLGICKYIKDHYNLENYIFSGASAGAWNSLLLCFNRDMKEIQEQLVDNSIQNASSIFDMEQKLKTKLLNKYTINDFDLRRLFIGVTTVNRYTYNTTIFSGFDSLEDTVNCCIASSHIPMITGGLTNIYQNFIAFDGGFSKYPYLNITKPVLHITPSIWNKNDTNKNRKMRITDYTTLFSKNKFVFIDMVEKGYRDAHENKEELDKIFLQ